MAQFGQELSFGNYKKAIFNLIKTLMRRHRHADSHEALRATSNIPQAGFVLPTQPPGPPQALYNTVVANFCKKSKHEKNCNFSFDLFVYKC